MATCLITVLIVALAMAGMSIGVLVADRRIRGSCGGLPELYGLEPACDVCTKPCPRRQADREGDDFLTCSSAGGARTTVSNGVKVGENRRFRSRQ